MIVEERIRAFVNSLGSANTPLLDEIETKAVAASVPVIKKETQGLLKLLLAVTKPENILEVGTAVAFSALFMEEYAPAGVKITTIENYAPRILAARENIKKAGKEKQVELLEGDARDVLPALQGTYDFVFMDAAKGQYIHFLPDILRLTSPGGLLISDNVLQEGDIIESHFAVTRRNRTIYKRMRAYLYELTHNERLETVILPVGDGIAVSYIR